MEIGFGLWKFEDFTNDIRVDPCSLYTTCNRFIGSSVEGSL